MKLPLTCSVFELQPELGDIEPERRTRQAPQRRVAHVVGDAPLRSDDACAVDTVLQRFAIHEAMLAAMNTATDPLLSASGLEWAQRLVRFNSVSDQSNLPLIECIADHFRSLGVQPRLTWDDERRKANLFATLGEGKPKGVILSGHTDTVPWTVRTGRSTRWAPACATAACTAAAAPT